MISEKGLHYLVVFKKLIIAIPPTNTLKGYFFFPGRGFRSVIITSSIRANSTCKGVITVLLVRISVARWISFESALSGISFVLMKTKEVSAERQIRRLDAALGITR